MLLPQMKIHSIKKLKKKNNNTPKQTWHKCGTRLYTESRTFQTVLENSRYSPKKSREGCWAHAFHFKKEAGSGRCLHAILGAQRCQLKLVWRENR